MKQRSYYMHTLNGKPAYFDPKQEIILFMRGGKANPLANSLRQIKRERKIDPSSREFRPDYRRVCLPAQEPAT